MEAQTPIEHRTSAPRARNQYSRITNSPQRPAISGRTALGKRLRDLAEFYAEALGGWATLSVTQAAAVRRCAELCALSEKARADALQQGNVDPIALVRLEGAASRAQRALHLDRKREPDLGALLGEGRARGPEEAA